jgi:hypothetical protein
VIGDTPWPPALVTIDASDASANPLRQLSGLALADWLTSNGPFEAADMSFATLSTALTDNTDLAAPSLSNSISGSNQSPVPEPSTLLLALLAVLVVISTQFARLYFRRQTV